MNQTLVGFSSSGGSCRSLLPIHLFGFHNFLLLSHTLFPLFIKTIHECVSVPQNLTIIYSVAVNQLSHVLLIFSSYNVLSFDNPIPWRTKKLVSFSLFHGLWMTHSLFVFFLRFGSALHSNGFRAFSASQTEGLLLISLIHILLLLIFAMQQFFYITK